MEEKLLNILEEICGDSIVREDLDINLIDEGLMDSLDFAELIVAIEDPFGVIISPSAVSREESDTPAKIIKVIKDRL